MLTELRIRNVAIIESVTLPLQPGFNVLSGETGAGKSIIVEALGLLFGERGSADIVRPGADRASVEGVFDARDDDHLRHRLDERGIDTDDGTVVLRREVSSSGRSRAWINGSTVTAGALAEIGRTLVTIHGQHESQGLLQPEAQRDILDAFGGAAAQAAAVAAAWDTLESLRGEIDALAKRRSATEKRADYLRHVTREIADAKLETGEDARLSEEARRLSHVEELRLNAGHLQEAIDGEDAGALRQLGAAQRALDASTRLDPALERLREMLDAAFAQLQEFSREVAAYESALDVDPGRLLEVEQRRDVLFRLARKHGGTVESALEALCEAQAELDLLDTAALDIGTLSQRAAAAETTLIASAVALTQKRKATTSRLQRDVDGLLPDLGMTGGRFTVAMTPRPAVERSGAESVEFLVALNVGHDARPLSRVASGGELSRVMLALTTILARLDRVPTLVFDEVDAGIGGRVGLCVGDTMRRVAAHRQVLAITHLPQIASRAHQHIVVSKAARGGVTTADLHVAEGEDRVHEIARMLGGDSESEKSRAHARELLEDALMAKAEAPAAGRSARGAKRGAS